MPAFDPESWLAVGAYLGRVNATATITPRTMFQRIANFGILRPVDVLKKGLNFACNAATMKPHPPTESTIASTQASIACPRCHASYDSVPGLSAEQPRSVKCSACGNVFAATLPRPIATEAVAAADTVTDSTVAHPTAVQQPSPRPAAEARRPTAGVWTVRTKAGESVSVSSLRSLQELVEHGALTESAEFARANGSWKQLGSFEELRGAFEARRSSVADQPPSNDAALPSIATGVGHSLATAPVATAANLTSTTMSTTAAHPERTAKGPAPWRRIRPLWWWSAVGGLVAAALFGLVANLGPIAPSSAPDASARPATTQPVKSTPGSTRGTATSPTASSIPAPSIRAPIAAATAPIAPSAGAAPTVAPPPRQSAASAAPMALQPSKTAPIEPLRPALSDDHKQAYLRELKAGRQSLGDKKPTEAVAHFQAALTHKPGAAEAIAGLGHAALLRGDSGDAIRRLRVAAKAGYLDATFELANVLLGVGNRTDAIASYRYYLEHRPRGNKSNLARAQLAKLGANAASATR